ncbi:hypothetical protein HanRHA438_Chr15g0718861 [Helianthus annuus]|nr:hypothetical protein HanIR_Chr15g0768671 [Helianthus annuus]KAJ0845900.1 hypothetical protein HanRHA438_Chr15g0718861 [Helianthus annuus]
MPQKIIERVKVKPESQGTSIRTCVIDVVQLFAWAVVGTGRGRSWLADGAFVLVEENIRYRLNN